MRYGAILCLGSELTSGAIQDGHGKYLSSFLTGLGFEIKSIHLAPDDMLLAEYLADLCKNVHLVVITGGLGPTSDDITREIVSSCAGSPLEFYEDLWREITERYHGLSAVVTNKKQAFIPRGFSVLPNPYGTAPGFWGKIGTCNVFALPGPPRELHGLVEDQLVTIVPSLFALPQLEKLEATSFLISESELEAGLQSLAIGDVHWRTRAEASRILFSLHGGTKGERERLLIALSKRYGGFCIRSGFIDSCILAFRALKREKLMLVTAESCTGGLITKLMTDIPGSSGVVWGGLVTYSNEAKERLLGVSELAANGAVSEQTVLSMAAGALSHSGADISVSVSGIAGPEGGTTDKPVGTVCIAILKRGGEGRAWRFLFHGSRSFVRTRTAVMALLLVEAAVLNAIDAIDLPFLTTSRDS